MGILHRAGFTGVPAEIRQIPRLIRLKMRPNLLAYKQKLRLQVGVELFLRRGEKEEDQNRLPLSGPVIRIHFESNDTEHHAEDRLGPQDLLALVPLGCRVSVIVVLLPVLLVGEIAKVQGKNEIGCC